MSAVTLPGTLPGLLRRGAPVVAANDIVHRRRTYAPEGHPGVVVERDDCWVTCRFSGGFCSPIRPDCLALDLTDSAGRDIAVRWGIREETQRRGPIRSTAEWCREVEGPWLALRDSPEALALACLAVSK